MAFRAVRHTLVGLLSLIIAACLQAAEPARYVYPPPENSADHRYDYYWELLDAALKATAASHGPYELSPHPQVMNSARALEMIGRPDGPTVMVVATSIERERTLLPLRIPLDKGLTGYRLFLTLARHQEALDQTRSLADLKAFTLGQGKGWVDVQILRNAGLTVEEGANYAGLFDMLSADRFQLFPRGINEIAAELAIGQQKNPNTVIERRLLLYYPLPRYFFFPRGEQGERLARRVDTGLQILRKTGEFDRRYLRFKQQVLSGLTLSGRRVFRMENPQLSPETPLAQPELWDSLSKELGASR